MQSDTWSSTLATGLGLRSGQKNYADTDVRGQRPLQTDVDGQAADMEEQQTDGLTSSVVIISRQSSNKLLIFLVQWQKR